MKRTKSVINGKPYWYVWDAIYLDRGVFKKTTKSLGPADSTPEEVLRKREAEFLNQMELLESSARTAYWHTRVNDRKAFPQNTVQKIEAARANLYRAKRELGPTAQSALNTAFLIDFIYNSNKIEGSRLPLQEVERLVTESKKKTNEVTATQRAKEYVDKSFAFTVSTLVQAHKFLLFDEPNKHGIRTGPIIVGNDEAVSEANTIRADLEQLFTWYQTKGQLLYPPERAFEFYFRFEKIHPFVDGNGRLGRLLMNKILKEAKYHPIIIWDKRRKAHFNAFERATEGYRTAFFLFMTEMLLKTYGAYSKKIEPAKTFDTLVSLFLNPTDE